jgi:hypothetical protein
MKTAAAPVKPAKCVRPVRALRGAAVSAPVLTAAMRAVLLAAARRADGVEYRDGVATMATLLDCEDAGLLTPTRTRAHSERWRITATGLDALRAEVAS